MLLVVTALMGCQQGCDEVAGDEILMDLRTEAPLTSLSVSLKWWDFAENIHVYEPNVLPIERASEAYVGVDSEDPLHLRIQLPGPGFYAVHIAADGPDGQAQTSTTCYAVAGLVVDPNVGLALLDPDNDEDGDTFPENIDDQCIHRASLGFPCVDDCVGPLSGAWSDCGPGSEFIPTVECGDFPGGDQVHPFAEEICGNCYDEDCDGQALPCADEDGDGYPGDVDCDDADPSINPGVDERPSDESLCGNGVDDNCRAEMDGCRGDVACDLDGDGFYAVHPQFEECGGDDCDDADPAINPWAYEGCGSNPESPGCPGCDDGIDNNCDGDVDEGCVDDLDQDGVTSDLDCNDCDSAVGPGFAERCGNGVDEDCDGEDLPCAANDADGDGVRESPAGVDCDDEDPHSLPDAPDYCGDAIAQDCILDVACSSIVDGDGDHFSAADDCDDGVASINPWGIEECDEAGADEDCDGSVNEVEDSESRQGCVFDPDGGSWRLLSFLDEMDHCGACRRPCVALPCINQGDVCVDGECRCAGSDPCGRDVTSFCCQEDGRPAGCRDLTTVEDCGECGHRCRPGEECHGTGSCGRGECICLDEGGPCPDDPCWECCPGAGCVNLCEDVDHCGSCGNDCDAGDHPRGNACVGSRCRCGPEHVQCSADTWCTEVSEAGGTTCGCADLDGDRSNCGGCGVECPPGESCSGGSCACGGGGGCAGTSTSYCCGDAGCVNLETSDEHCGGCDRDCDSGEHCEGGECVCGDTGDTCPSDRRCCADGHCELCCDDGDCSDGDSCCSDDRCHDCCDDGDCGDGESCCDGQCRECCDDGDCGGDDRCCDGECHECCNNDGHCDDGQHCCWRYCRECCDDDDCPGSHWCDHGRCN